MAVVKRIMLISKKDGMSVEEFRHTILVIPGLVPGIHLDVLLDRFR